MTGTRRAEQDHVPGADTGADPRLLLLAPLLDAIPDPAALMTDDGRLRFVNQALDDRLGWTIATLGESPPFPAWPPERRDDYRILLSRILEHTRATAGGMRVPVELLDRNGTRHPMIATVVTVALDRPVVVSLLREPDDPRDRLLTVERVLRRLTAELHQLNDGQAHATQVATASHLADRARLSAAQRAVLELFAQGESVAQIAERLGRSPHTVRGHLKAIYRRLSVASQDELRRMLHRPTDAP